MAAFANKNGKPDFVTSCSSMRACGENDRAESDIERRAKGCLAASLSVVAIADEAA